MQDLNMKSEYISREFNVGFSGGEKKKNEIKKLDVKLEKLHTETDKFTPAIPSERNLNGSEMKRDDSSLNIVN